MKFSRTLIHCIVVAAAISGATLRAAEPTAAALEGVWELKSATNWKTGETWVTDANVKWWLLITRSHWAALEATRDRKPVSGYDALSADDKLKVDRARVWNDMGQQVFAARGGTYRLEGDKMHATAEQALYAEIIGVDRVLRIVRLDKDTLTVRTEFADQPQLTAEFTYRRIE